MPNAKLHFVYRTINGETGEYYIGLHSTRNLDDGYLGSGMRLKAAIAKCGIAMFRMFILATFKNRHDAYQMEKEAYSCQYW